jgi:putative pyruvate formate lyase activating enzyme
MHKQRDKSIQLAEHMQSCSLCGNRCHTDRDKGEPSLCGASATAEVSHIEVHHGEEPPISGTRGCGNIFFHNCSLSCVYCQNWQISNDDAEAYRYLSAGELADEMLKLQDLNVDTLGLVTPTSHLPTLIPALEQARKRGLSLPIIYNTSAYDTVTSLHLVEGLVDVYLPDMKYGSNDAGQIYSGVADYVNVSRAAVKEMVRQVGGLKVDSRGIAQSGVIIRHLILPGGMADTVEVLQWIAQELPHTVPVSLMSQYKPAFQVADGLFPELQRKITRHEYEFYLAAAEEVGLEYLFVQDLQSAEVFIPDFSRAHPFDP